MREERGRGEQTTIDKETPTALHCSETRVKLSIKQHAVLGEGKNETYETNEKKRRRRRKQSEKKELDRGN